MIGVKKGKNRISNCHGWTRNLTEKTEAETRKKINAAAEAFATEGHGLSRKVEQAWNPVFATLTIAGRAPFGKLRGRDFYGQ